MKIVVPMPADPSMQRRVEESLHLWKSKEPLLVCLVEACDLPFLEFFETAVMDRNSGSAKPRCYLRDMLQEVMKRYPEEDWYGICNSDCVPVADLVEGYSGYEALIFHRTDIPDWDFRHNIGGREILPKDILNEIHEMRREGISDKKIARKLNRAEVPPPKGHVEWTYTLLQRLFFERGIVYFWGQDMFLFRREVMEKVMGYIHEKDFLVGVGGFDQRITQWCSDNLKSTRVFNRIVHKAHTSEWSTDEQEYRHNGGDITDDERMKYINDTLRFTEKVENWVPYTVENPLTFITTRRMVDDTYLASSFLPSDLDAIVGIARSGLVPAGILSCHLHLPVFVVSDKWLMDCGAGARFKNKDIDPSKVLVVDDTVFAGRTMKRVLPVIRNTFPKATIIKMAIYVTPQAKHLVDHFACELAEPHYLEWNLFNAGPGESAIYDMDGIICHDIAAADDDDGARYVRALRNATPKYLPRKAQIPMIVTARLERYRETTMEWLGKYGVRVERLVMGPWRTLAERNHPNVVATFKANVYGASGYELFVESCPIQAEEICRQTGKRVLCPAAERVFS